MSRPAMLRRAELRVAQIWHETHDTKTFRVAAPPSGLPEFKPGQFYALEVQSADGAWIRRSYSIASSPREHRHFDLTIKSLDGGAATGVLFRHLKPGDAVRATGPFGEFTLDETKPAIFVAGGVGVTPIMSMLRYLSEMNSSLPACLLYANRELRDVIYEKELRELELRHSNFRFHYTLTRHSGSACGWRGRIGRFDSAAIHELCATMSDRIAYLCGPVSMMEEAGKELVSLGLPAANIRTEAFVGTNPTFGNNT